MAKIVVLTILLPVLISLAHAHNDGYSSSTHGTCDLEGENLYACSDSRKEALRFVMVGMTGTGKSQTGNMIVGLAQNMKPFLSHTSSESVTVTGKRADVTLYGRQIAIVDTPGFFDTRFSVETTITEILQCTNLIPPGPHAILMVVKADRQTDEVLTALDLMKKVFGNELVKYLIIVFTYGDNLKRDGETIDEFVDRLKGPYKQLLQEADNRYVLFDNTLDPTSEDNEQQVQHLIDMADEIVVRNHGQFYRNDLLEESYKLMQEEKKERARKLEEERKRKEELERKARENEILQAELKRQQAEKERIERETREAAACAKKAQEELAAAEAAAAAARAHQSGRRRRRRRRWF